MRTSRLLSLCSAVPVWLLLASGRCSAYRAHTRSWVASARIVHSGAARTPEAASPSTDSVSPQGGDFDIAPFARRCCVEDNHSSQVAFDYGEAQQAGAGAEKAPSGHYIYGLQWAEERDISEVSVSFRGEPQEAALEYWFRNWPFPPPQMPSIEDPVDDPWQGKWLKAETVVTCQGSECHYKFAPLRESENPYAKNLPALSYRHTLKLRLVFNSDPKVGRVGVYSGSVAQPVELRVELGAGENAQHVWEGNFEVYNGVLRGVRLWKSRAGDAADEHQFRVTSGGQPQGLLLSLTATKPSLSGSRDVTVVTMNAGDRTFSFATPDLDKGPMYLPDFHVYVTFASDARRFSPAIVKRGTKIRERLLREPEQTYERAAKDIPALDPAHREYGGPLYLPLGADASWQKFAVEWGGNVRIEKEGTKAKGEELRRLEWSGDRITWRLGTGRPPTYRSGWHDSKLSILEDYLPVAKARWTTQGVEYSEESFATLLSGPLSPDDPGRSEQTPALLMMKLTARNPGSGAANAEIYLATTTEEQHPHRQSNGATGELLSFSNQELTTHDGQLLRARVQVPPGVTVRPGIVPDGMNTLHGIHVQANLGPGESTSILIKLPFIPRLSDKERRELAGLDYDAERARVVQYWRQVTDRAVPYSVPEPRFQSFSKAVIPHIRISVTKDPKSGLYMVPAAGYVYGVFGNEAIYQTVMLDAFGQHQLASEYLETFVRLQGSQTFAGSFAGDQKDTFHGARVDGERDYTMGEYVLDHGAVMWALAEHYFFTRDREWMRGILPNLIRAADWTIQQRKLTQVLFRGKEVPEYGLLPAGNLEDNPDWWHWFAINAVAAAALDRFAQALADVGDERAGQYAQEAAAYTQDLREAVRRATRLAPVIRLRDATYRPFVPSRPYQRLAYFGPTRGAYYERYPAKALPLYRLSSDREVLSGPLLLLIMNVFHADEPVADWVLDNWEDNQTTSVPWGLNVHGWVDEAYWFSRGGMVFQANLQNPYFVYLQRHEIPAALRSLYDGFVACLYPDVNALTEEYHQWVRGSGPFYKVSDESQVLGRIRGMLVLEFGDELWLAPGIPRRWLAPGRRIELRDAPTYFGPASYSMVASGTGVEARVELPRRNPYKKAWLVVRAPDGKRIRSVEIDGKAWSDFDAAQERIRLPLKASAMQVLVHF